MRDLDEARARISYVETLLVTRASRTRTADMFMKVASTLNTLESWGKKCVSESLLRNTLKRSDHSMIPMTVMHLV